MKSGARPNYLMRGERGTMRSAYWLSTVALLLSLEAVHGESYKLKSALALDGVVNCIWARDRLITIISGPCDDYTPPRYIRIGETFQANGKNKTINVVIGDKIEKEIPQLGLKTGDWICTAAESAKDIPGDEPDHTGTWLYVPKCRPIE
jgi:hypothetical protein